MNCLINDSIASQLPHKCLNISCSLGDFGDYLAINSKKWLKMVNNGLMMFYYKTPKGTQRRHKGDIKAQNEPEA